MMISGSLSTALILMSFLGASSLGCWDAWLVAEGLDEADVLLLDLAAWTAGLSGKPLVKISAHVMRNSVQTHAWSLHRTASTGIMEIYKVIK